MFEKKNVRLRISPISPRFSFVKCLWLFAVNSLNKVGLFTHNDKQSGSISQSVEAEQTMSRLVEIPSSEWPRLQEKFVADWPKEFCGYYLVDNYIRWIQQEPHIKNLAFYSLDGDWSDGTFCVVVSQSNVYYFPPFINLLYLHSYATVYSRAW